MNETTQYRQLYPEIEPYRSCRLPVDARHELYLEECGQPDGVPVLFLHGGPGGGISSQHRRFFDPARYRIVLFDQRGAGRSSPAGEIQDNSTPHLLADIEHIRQTLGITRWVVFGGSWGSTLALAYAQAFPATVLALVLRGLFLGGQEEIDWFNERTGGARYVLPERWSAYEATIPAAERAGMVEAYWRRLDDPDPAIRRAAGLAWSAWNSSGATLLHDPDGPLDLDPVASEMTSRIELHYFRNRCFLAEGQLLQDIARLRHIPATLVHGRYDLLCPMKFAHELAQVWPELDLRVVLSGHSAFDAATVDALVSATDDYAARLWPAQDQA